MRLLVVTPAYNKPTQEGLYRHFEAVAAASSVPVVLYNVPSRTAVDLLPATVARLAKLPRIVAVKEAVASMERVRELVACRPVRSSRCCRAMMRRRPQAMLNGARGVISVTANVVPEAMAELCAAALCAAIAARGRAHRCAAARAARGAVLRAQSDSGEMGHGGAGSDRTRHPPAADRAVRATAPARAAPRSKQPRCRRPLAQAKSA